jgi:hypothetical protein
VWDTFISFLLWVEETSLAVWVGESVWGFPISLTLHALGMGFLAGGNVAIALRLLGAASSIPLASLLRLYPLLWGSAVLSLISGIMLLSAYPAKALTNGVFYFKMTLVAVGLALLAKPVRRLLQLSAAGPPPQQRPLGMAMVLIWLATITAGRFLAYTHHVLRALELTRG